MFGPVEPSALWVWQLHKSDLACAVLTGRNIGCSSFPICIILVHPNVINVGVNSPGYSQGMTGCQSSSIFKGKEWVTLGDVIVAPASLSLHIVGD